MIATLRAAFMALVLLMAGIAAAKERPVVLELFTSQGCSSCPPADALLHEFAKENGIIPLAFHVDYWDYIGWKDTFSKPSFTNRQRQYARAMGEQMIYTPQIIINGSVHLVGNDRAAIMQSVKKSVAKPRIADLQTQINAQQITVHLSNGQNGQYEIRHITYRPKSTITITRGENAGRTIEYANVVTSHQIIGEWNGRGDLTVDTAASQIDRNVILLQRKGHGEIVAAALVQ